MRWVGLESVIQSEVSQKEKNKSVCEHIYMESKKNGYESLRLLFVTVNPILKYILNNYQIFPYQNLSPILSQTIF